MSFLHVFVFLTFSSAFAADSDTFTFIAQKHRYIDYIPAINSHLTTHISNCVKGNLRGTVLYSCLAYFSALQASRKFEQGLDAIISYPTPSVEDTIYACSIDDRKVCIKLFDKSVMLAKIFMYDYNGTMLYISTDKIVHMFVAGLFYATGSLTEEVSAYLEKDTWFGMGDCIAQYSYGDLYANARGGEMWKDIKKSLKCNPFCKFSTKFSIEPYLHPVLDESINENHIKNPCVVLPPPRLYPDLSTMPCKFYHAINPVLSVNMSCPGFTVDRF